MNNYVEFFIYMFIFFVKMFYKYKTGSLINLFFMNRLLKNDQTRSCWRISNWHRNINKKDRALTRGAFKTNSPILQFNIFLTQDQSQTDAAFIVCTQGRF